MFPMENYKLSHSFKALGFFVNQNRSRLINRSCPGGGQNSLTKAFSGYTKKTKRNFIFAEAIFFSLQNISLRYKTITTVVTKDF